MQELKEKLLVAIVQATVTRAGVDVQSIDVHAEAVVRLANAIAEKASKKDK